MKKFLAILMAVMCVCTMGVAAESGAINSTESSDDSASVLYQVNSGYTWSIHSDIDFGDDAGIDGLGANADLEIDAQTVAVTRNIIPDGKKLRITIDAYSCDALGTKKTDNVFQVANGNSQLAYTVNNGTADLAIGGTVLDVAAGTNTGSQALTFTLDTSKLAGAASNLAAEVAGDYHGKVVYTATVVAQ